MDAEEMKAVAMQEQCQTALVDWAKDNPADMGAIHVVASLMGKTGDAAAMLALQPHQCRAVAMLLCGTLGDIHMQLCERSKNSEPPT